jgi:hypothetical protein
MVSSQGIVHGIVEVKKDCARGGASGVPQPRSPFMPPANIPCLLPAHFDAGEGEVPRERRWFPPPGFARQHGVRSFPTHHQADNPLQNRVKIGCLAPLVALR